MASAEASSSDQALPEPTDAVPDQASPPAGADDGSATKDEDGEQEGLSAVASAVNQTSPRAAAVLEGDEPSDADNPPAAVPAEGIDAANVQETGGDKDTSLSANSKAEPEQKQKLIYTHKKTAGPAYDAAQVQARLAERKAAELQKFELQQSEAERTKREIQDRLEKQKAKQAMEKEKEATRMSQARERQAKLQLAKGQADAEKKEREAELIQKKLRLQAVIFQRMMRAGQARMFASWKLVWMSEGRSELAQGYLAEAKAARKARREEMEAMRAAEEAERARQELQAFSMSSGKTLQSGATCCIVA